jgi:hypothetical protein
MREKSSLLPRKIGLAKEKLVLGMLLLGGKKKKKRCIYLSKTIVIWKKQIEKRISCVKYYIIAAWRSKLFYTTTLASSLAL